MSSGNRIEFSRDAIHANTIVLAADQNFVPYALFFIDQIAAYYCCFAQQKGIKTIAVDPVPSNVTYIAQNMAANGWGDNITVLPVAAGESTGFIDIYGI